MKKKNIVDAISDIQQILDSGDSALPESHKITLIRARTGLQEAIKDSDEVIVDPETINQALQFMLLLWEIMHK